jgi:hypothetical protein
MAHYRLPEWPVFNRSRVAGFQRSLTANGVRIPEEMLALCYRDGIRVLLVYSPVYYEMQALERNRDDIFALFKEVAVRHRATLWDYSRSPISYRKDYFYNSQHLNADGAAAFSAELARALTASPLVGASR